MKKNLFDRRIPTVIALLILLIVVGISTILVQQGIFYVSKAAPDTLPQNTKVTDVTDTTFTVIFTTAGLADASVGMIDAKTGNSIILDDRDKKTGIQNKYYSHRITVSSLTPQSTYVFKLIVAGQTYTNSKFAVRTGATIANAPPPQNSISGKVLLPDGSLASDTIVTATTNLSQTISTITDDKGEFVLPANSLRDTVGDTYSTLDANTIITLNFFRQSMNTKVVVAYSLSQNLPPVTLLQQYAFLSGNEASATGSSQLAFSPPTSSGKTFGITLPSQNESFVDQQPLFSGTSYPGSSVDILIPGVAQQTIITDQSGSWSFRTTDSIPTGHHTISIETTDPDDKKVSVVRNFSIFPQGSQVLTDQLKPTTSPTVAPTATPTLTPTMSPSPTLSPTQIPNPAVSPTATPTSVSISPTPTGKISQAVSPTATPTISPSPTAIPTVFSKPTKEPTIANPGSTENTIALTGISIALIIAGTVLLFAL